MHEIANPSVAENYMLAEQFETQQYNLAAMEGFWIIFSTWKRQSSPYLFRVEKPSKIIDFLWEFC